MEEQSVLDLSPHPFNIQIYGKPDDGLKQSLREFGLSYPVEVDPQRRILSGARRWSAAKALGWKTIETRVIPVADEAEAQRHILLANHYRSIKTPFVRKQEADAYLRLLADEQVDKAELERMAKEQKRPPKTPADHAPGRLAARAAGLSPTVYGEVSFITDRDRAERQVDQALAKDKISKPAARKLKSTIRKTREDLRHDRVAATTAAHDVRQKLRTAEREHGYSYEERRFREVNQKVELIVRIGDRFAAALRDLEHAADVKYLTPKHAFRMSATLEEINDATNALIRKAGNPKPSTTAKSPGQSLPKPSSNS